MEDKNKIIFFNFMLFLILRINFAFTYSHNTSLSSIDNNINIYNSSFFKENLSSSSTEINNNCDPDINLDVNRCFIYAKFYLSQNIKNISNVLCDFFNPLMTYTKYYDIYNNNVKTCAWYFDAPSGAVSCEDFFVGNFLFNLSTSIYAGTPSNTNISLPWEVQVCVWSCDGDPTYANCTGDKGSWHICIDSINTSYVLVPNNNVFINNAYGNNIILTPSHSDLYVYVGNTFDVEVEARNVKDDAHGGSSINSWVNFSSSPFHLSLNSADSVFIGNVSSGSSEYVNFTFNADSLTPESGDVLVFNYSDSSQYYSDNVSLNVHVVNLSITSFYVEGYVEGSQPFDYKSNFYVGGGKRENRKIEENRENRGK